MNPSRPQQQIVLAGLAVLMAITRHHHFAPVPDASWAIYFIGGFYLRGLGRWAFPALMLEAVVIDALAVRHLGVSSACFTPAYAFLVPTHAVLWISGSFLRARASLDRHGFAALVASAFVAVSLAFAVSSGSFYWLGGLEAAPTLAGYGERFAAYYPHFLVVPCVYLAIAAAVHVALHRSRRSGAEHAAQP